MSIIKIYIFVLELILCYFYTTKKKEQKAPSLKYRLLNAFHLFDNLSMFI